MYKTTVTDFIYAIQNEYHEFLSELKKHVSTNVGDEESYVQLSKLLAGIVKDNKEFGHVEILFEYKPPCYSGYSDVILLGKKDDVPCAYVIELKNWSQDRVCQRYIGRKKRNGEYPINYNNAPCDHPSTQVKGYVTALKTTHSAVVEPKGYETPQVRGVVFFTNPDFNDSSLKSYRNKPFDQLTEDYPVFNCQSASLKALSEDIKNHLAEGDEAFKEKFLKGTYTQSYELQQFACHAIQSYLSDGTAEKPFALSETQEEAFGALFDALKKALENPSEKKVFVVKGLPGTGKTAVAVNLLVEALKLADRHRELGNVVFTSATTNAKTWENIFNSDEKVLISTKEFNPGINGSNNAQAIQLFEDAGLGHLIEMDGNGKRSFRLDRWRDVWAALRDGMVDTGRPQLTENMHSLTIVDEAHSLINPIDDDGGQVMYNRLGNWFSKVGPQAYYIIYTSRVSVFFMEDAQGFQDRETTKVEDIRRLAEELKVPFNADFELTEQFRCGHSAEYMEWVDRLFSDSSIANHASWKNKFIFDVFDYPNKMEDKLRSRMQCPEHPSGRLLSSYSVAWLTKNKSNKHSLPSDQMDFQLKNADGTAWSRCWNTPGEFVSPLTNDAMLDDPLCEVGYPQEIRGWDFSFFGILWLDDVVWRTDRWKIRLSSVSFDDGIASQRKIVVDRFNSWGYNEKLLWNQTLCNSLPDKQKQKAEELHSLVDTSRSCVVDSNSRAKMFKAFGYREMYVWDEEEFQKLENKRNLNDRDQKKIASAMEAHKQFGDRVDMDKAKGKSLHTKCYSKKWVWDQERCDSLLEEDQKKVANGLHKFFGDLFYDAEAREKLTSLGYSEQMIWKQPRGFNNLSDDEKEQKERMHKFFGDSAEYVWYTNGSIPEIDRLCVTMFRIYRILLTRAIVGNFVYIKDKETREHVRGLLK